MNKPEKEITIKDLYPNFTAKQLKEAEENFQRYLEIALEIYDDICSDSVRYEKFKRDLKRLKAKLRRYTA